MQRRTKTIIAAAALSTAVVAGAGITAANHEGNGVDDAEAPIAGPELDQASAVALAHTGGGRVTGTEIGDEDSFYEVEVTRDDGSQVDVQLDEQFNVVFDKADDDAIEPAGEH